MTDRPYGENWWLASDGKWYPPEVRSGEPVPPPPSTAQGDPGRRPLSAGLTTTLQWVFLASGVLSLATAVAVGVENSHLDADRVRRSIDVFEALGPAGVLLSLLTLSGLAGGILMIIWLFQAYGVAAQRGPAHTSWSQGWAIGAWFIPFGNLVLPKLVVNELDLISHPSADPEPIGDRWRDSPMLQASHWWWGLTLASGIMFTAGYGVVLEQIDSFGLVERTYRAGMWVLTAGLLTAVGAAATGAMVVRDIGKRLTR
jgi:hypothetical protein